MAAEVGGWWWWGGEGGREGVWVCGCVGVWVCGWVVVCVEKGEGREEEDEVCACMYVCILFCLYVRMCSIV